MIIVNAFFEWNFYITDKDMRYYSSERIKNYHLWELLRSDVFIRFKLFFLIINYFNEFL